MNVRKPVAIGFYPSTKSELIKIIEKSFLHELGPGELPAKKVYKNTGSVLGGVSPHAGYIYSGPIAAHLYYELSKISPETVIILGPSHGGYAGVSVMSEGSWETPLGLVEINSRLAEKIRVEAGRDANGASYIISDEWPHLTEHSLEVQIPFLQYIYGDGFKIVPIVCGGVKLKRCIEIGERIAKIVDWSRTVIIASTDMTHYGSMYYGFSPVGDGDIHKILDWMAKTDGGIIESVKKLDPEAAYNMAGKTTMCGYVPVTVLTALAKSVGVKDVKVLKYSTSYDVRGSKDAIVGYLSMLFTL
ncbi:MAG: AmmeMemoRadiSam system protein B [Candidatus Odinarchaeota archaeon]